MKEYEVVIIGGGPSGLTAGLYCARYGLKTILLERGLYGGQIVNASHIDNYPGFPLGISGMELGQLIYDQASKYGLESLTMDVGGIKKAGALFEIACEDGQYSSPAVIVATGAAYRKIGLEAEERLNGRGISYCATCDGFLFKNMDVAVVGGGDTAITDALELSQHCSKVYVIHRRDQLRASNALQRIAFTIPKIQFVWDTVIDDIVGKEKLETLELRNVKSGRQSALNLSGLFVALGSTPNSQLFEGFLALDENKNIVTDELMRTSQSGVFAAGDVRKNSPKQVATAVGDGATAAKGAFSYLKER